MQNHNCEDELRKANLKVTPARLGVLSALEQTDMPLDVNSIIKFLKKQKIKADKVTVFRIVNALTQKGLAAPVQLNEGKLRYEYAKEDHHHFICETCGSITDVSDCNIGVVEKDIQNKKGFLVKRHSLEFFGICSDCQK
jgi:Fur family ferric uptake transcriptional regulator